VTDVVVKKFTFAISSPDELFVSEREREFTFAICYRYSDCRSSVTFVHPTQAIEIFAIFSTLFGIMAIY